MQNGYSVTDATWGALVVGDSILGADGHVWRVKARAGAVNDAGDPSITLERPGKNPVTATPKRAGKVKVVHTAEMEAAKNLAQAGILKSNMKNDALATGSQLVVEQTVPPHEWNMGNAVAIEHDLQCPCGEAPDHPCHIKKPERKAKFVPMAELKPAPAKLAEDDMFGAPAGPALMGRSGVKRDQWGRAVLPDPVTGEESAWTAVTTLAGILEDKTGLTTWQKRNVAKGVASRVDLALLAASADLNTKEGKATLGKVVKDAEEFVGANSGANIGTALHNLCQRLDAGEDRKKLNIPDPYGADIDAYLAALAEKNLTVLPEYVEQLVVNQETHSAGSFDNILEEADGTLVIADKKTAPELKYGHLTMAIQQAQYAYAGWIWDKRWKEYVPMPKVRRDYALIIHLPAGKRTCTILKIDLTRGWAAAQVAASVHGTWRRERDWLTSY